MLSEVTVLLGTRCLVTRLGVRHHSTIHQFQAVLLDGTKVATASKTILILKTASANTEVSEPILILKYHSQL